MLIKDCWWTVLSFFDYIELQNLRFISKEFNDIVQDKNFLSFWCKRLLLNFNNNMSLNDLKLMFNKNLSWYYIEFTEEFLLENSHLLKCKSDDMGDSFFITKKVKEKYEMEENVRYPSRELFLEQKVGEIQSSYLPVDFDLLKTEILDLNDDILERYELWKYEHFLKHHNISYKLKRKYNLRVDEMECYPVGSVKTKEEMLECLRYYTESGNKNVLRNAKISLNKYCNPDLLFEFPEIIDPILLLSNKKFTLEHYLKIQKDIEKDEDFTERIEMTKHINWLLETSKEWNADLFIAALKNEHLEYKTFLKYKKQILKSLSNLNDDFYEGVFTAKTLKFMNDNEDVLEPEKSLGDCLYKECMRYFLNDQKKCTFDFDDHHLEGRFCGIPGNFDKIMDECRCITHYTELCTYVVDDIEYCGVAGLFNREFNEYRCENHNKEK